MAISNFNSPAPTPGPVLQARPKKAGKLFIVVGALLGIAFLGYVLSIFLNPAEQQVITNTGTVQNPGSQGGNTNVSQEARDIVEAIDLLDRVRIDTDFFNDPRFNQLVETPVMIPDPATPQRRVFDLRSNVLQGAQQTTQTQQSQPTSKPSVGRR